MRVPYQSRPNEAGGVVSFIVIGIILAALFVGGVALVKSRSEGTAVNPVTETSEQTQSEETTPEDQSASPSEESDKNASQDEVSQDVAPAPHQNTGDTEEIAATGPADTFITMLVLGLVAGTITRFVQSRISTTQQ